MKDDTLISIAFCLAVYGILCLIIGVKAATVLATAAIIALVIF